MTTAHTGGTMPGATVTTGLTLRGDVWRDRDDGGSRQRHARGDLHFD
jgi:hypothetical protein